MLGIASLQQQVKSTAGGGIHQTLWLQWNLRMKRAFAKSGKIPFCILTGRHDERDQGSHLAAAVSFPTVAALDLTAASSDSSFFLTLTGAFHFLCLRRLIRLGQVHRMVGLSFLLFKLGLDGFCHGVVILVVILVVCEILILLACG